MDGICTHLHGLLYICKKGPIIISVCTIPTRVKTESVSLIWIVIKVWPSLMKVEACTKAYISGMTHWFCVIAKITCYRAKLASFICRYSHMHKLAYWTTCACINAIPMNDNWKVVEFYRNDVKMVSNFILSSCVTVHYSSTKWSKYFHCTVNFCSLEENQEIYFDSYC